MLASSPTPGRSDYGFDQPNVPILLGLGGAAGLVVGLVSWQQGWGLVPTGDASFDTVLSSLVVHNIHSSDDRRRALVEAVRVLRPGSRLLIADIMHLDEYRRQLERLGLTDVSVRELGPRMWFGNPFLQTRLVSGVKPIRIT